MPRFFSPQLLLTTLLHATLLLVGKSDLLLAQEVNVAPVAISSAGTTAGTTAELPAEQPTEKEPAQQQAPLRFILPPELHAWAQFQPGAWREVRIITDTFSQAGGVINRSTTTQKEVLKAVAEETYAIDVQATVDLVGKRIVGDWKTRVLKLATDNAGEITRVLQKDNIGLAYQGADVDCQVWELRYLDDSRQMIDRILFHPQHYPFVILRETSEFVPESSTQPVEQIAEVTASTVPYEIKGKMASCSCLRITRQRAKGNSTRLVFIAPTVPGGEVAAWSSDFDSQGKLTRWSTLELLDFGQPDSQQSTADSR